MNDPEIYHVIKDPVHGTMQFSSSEDKWIKPFINSPNFQRLRHIKQLGMGDFIFPGAVHTRFNHCLGCCYVSSQIAHKIGLAEEERQLVTIACLLHDIGHGPFSHAFEDIFHNKLIRHEAWTPLFLAEYRTKEFFSYYNQQNPRQHLTEEKFSLIEDMIMHRSSTKALLSDIVSSQLDADRLDYLLRDSHFCGVTYGEFDFRWMINCMTIIQSKQGERLGITYKGTGVVEHYLMARRLMTRNIYHHPKKLALEYLLIKLLGQLAESLNHYSIFRGLKETGLGKFLIKVNEFNQLAKTNTNIQILRENFLKENYQNYKELSDYDVFAAVKFLAATNDAHPAAQIAKRIQFRDMPKIIKLDHVNIDAAENLISRFKNQHSSIQDWQVTIIKTPVQSYTIEDDPILVLTTRGTIKPINELSLMIDAISNKLENSIFLCVDRMIFEEDIVQTLIKNITDELSTVSM